MYFSKFFLETAKVEVQSHDFRTTKITELLEGGASLRAVQRYVGHKSPATTLGYHKLSTTQATQ